MFSLHFLFISRSRPGYNPFNYCKSVYNIVFFFKIMFIIITTIYYSSVWQFTQRNQKYTMPKKTVFIEVNSYFSISFRGYQTNAQEYFFGGGGEVENVNVFLHNLSKTIHCKLWILPTSYRETLWSSSLIPSICEPLVVSPYIDVFWVKIIFRTRCNSELHRGVNARGNSIGGDSFAHSIFLN